MSSSKFIELTQTYNSDKLLINVSTIHVVGKYTGGGSSVFLSDSEDVTPYRCEETVEEVEELLRKAGANVFR